jgi:hypothetical protein
MIHLKYEGKVNFVKLFLIWIYRWLKLIFENATAGRDTGCRSVVNPIHLEFPAHLLPLKCRDNEVASDDWRGSHEGAYGNDKAAVTP